MEGIVLFSMLRELDLLVIFTTNQEQNVGNFPLEFPNINHISTEFSCIVNVKIINIK